MNNNEPIVLGKVKKGASGKPLIVLIVFLFIGSVVLFLPTITSYFGDYNIIDLIKSGEIIEFIINHDSYINKESIDSTTNTNNVIENKVINSKATLEYKSITLSNFVLTKEYIQFDINTKNPIDFDKLNYYLIISKENKDLSTIKLTGYITNKNTFNFKFLNNLESTIELKGIIKEIRETEYPEYTLSSDETGLASLICIKDNDKYEYIFDSNYLIKIKQTYNYIDNNDGSYYNTFEQHSKLKEKINNSNGISNIEENYNGFIFSTDIDLTTYTAPIDINNNYYSLNTKTNKIKFEMNAKGYDCE